MNDAIDALLRELAAKTLEPDRPALDRARAAVRKIASPREACEALVAQGLLPTTFLSDGARRFAFTTAPKELCEEDVTRLTVGLTGRSVRAAPLPTTSALAAALAANAEAFVAAEVLAIEAAARLWPWANPRVACSAPTAIVWSSYKRTSMLKKGRHHEVDGSFTAHYVTLGAIGQTAGSERGTWCPTVGVSTRLMELASEYVLGSHAWKIAVENDAVVPGQYSMGYIGSPMSRTPAALVGKPFRALRDPFEPIVELWQRGYQLISLGKDAILLGVAPV